MLTAAAAIVMFRILAGPSTLDRLVALDTLVAVAMCAIGTWAAFSLDTTVTYGLTALALIGFIGLVRFPDTLSRMHAATKPQVLGLLLVLVGAAIRLRGNVDVGMLILTGMFAVITAPVVANRVGQLAYREQNLKDMLTKDELHTDPEGEYE